jgi:DNA invertase Pin-like site-specific DNA recombinase
MKAKAYSYVRFSTRDQIKGDSLRRQTEAAAAWCKRNGVALQESYRDLGVSAFKGKNVETGALSEFLTLVRNGRIEKGSYLIVESLDRVSRDKTMDALDLFSSIGKAGIVIVTLSDGQVYDREKINDNPMQLVISLTVMMRANEESKIKSMRVAAAWESKRNNADKQKLTGRCVAWLELSPDRSRFEPIPERVSVVRRIFDMAAKGHGANSITKTLQRENLPTFGRASGWHVSYVKKIIDNRAVLGEFTPFTSRTKSGKREACGEAVQGYYPAVVKRETFATVQQLRKARPSYNGRSGFNVFSHLAYDAQGKTMVYVNKDRKKGWHYLVSAAALLGKAPYHAWKYDEFLALFLLICQQAALAPKNKIEPETAKLDIARSELDEVEKQISRLVDFLIRGESASVEGKLREMEIKKLELAARVKELENEVQAKPADPAKINWKDRAALKENLRATVRRITVDPAVKSFQATFLDGREYALKVKDGTATVTMPSGEAEVFTETSTVSFSEARKSALAQAN